MKKYILASILLFSVGVLFGQITYGVKAGVNVSSVTKIHAESRSKLGLQAGFFASIPLDNGKDRFYFQPELLYSQQGEINDRNIGKETISSDYISIPLLFKTYFSQQLSDLYFEIGPQVAFLVNENIEADGNFALEYPFEEFNSFDLMLTAGLGYSINREFEIGVRYAFGLSDVSEKGKRKNPINRTSNLQFSVAYRF